MKRKIVVTFKDGHSCEHNPVVQSDDEWGMWVDKVAAQILTLKGGFLILNQPFGLHRVDEIASIHFSDPEYPVRNASQGILAHGGVRS